MTSPSSHSSWHFVASWLRGIGVVGRRLRNDRASVAISFLLCLPIFLTIVAIIVQLALLVNGGIIVSHAADTAARSAMTCLPEGRTDEIRRAARMAVVPLSPQASASADPEAIAMHDALTTVGLVIPDSFIPRYTYAMDATTVVWPQADYLHSDGRTIEVTVKYKFRLTVPIANVFIGGADTVGGIPGHYFELRTTALVQTAHSRESRAGGNGWPQ